MGTEGIPMLDDRVVTRGELRQAIALIVRYIHASMHLTTSPDQEEFDKRTQAFLDAGAALEAAYNLEKLMQND